MRLSENRTIAWIVFALAVIAALSLSGNALEKNALEMRDDAVKVFYAGAKGDGLSIDSDLKARARSAYALIGIADRYPAVAPSLIEAASSAQKAMDEANGLAQIQIGARSDANAQMGRAVENLYTALNNAPLSDADRKDVQSLYDDFTSHGNTIGRDPFNGLAEQYNQDVKKMYASFPASLIVGIKGGPPALELF